MNRKTSLIVNIMIALMLVICLLVNTYAWSDRKADSGNSLVLTDYKLSINGQTAAQPVTYQIIDGAEVKVSDDAVFEVSDGTVLNFMTVISNEGDGALDSNISLFLKEASCASGFSVIVSEPSYVFNEYDMGVDNDWVRVIPSCEILAGKTVEFFWSIKINSAGTDGTFTIGSFVMEYF